MYRVRRLRKLLSEKKWKLIQYECFQIEKSLESNILESSQVGIFAKIAKEKLLEVSDHSLVTPKEAKKAVELLIQEIDAYLVYDQEIRFV